jgi:hypothetical protein
LGSSATTETTIKSRPESLLNFCAQWSSQWGKLKSRLLSSTNAWQYNGQGAVCGEVVFLLSNVRTSESR